MRLLLAIGVFAVAAVLPGSAFAATGYHSACGVELSSDVPSTPGGPTCGTDEGDDAVFSGEPQALTFFGENGHDTVEGSGYGDVVQGGPGNDEIYGERGADYIDGGDDSDTVLGGPGNDTVYRVRHSSSDGLSTGRADASIPKSAGCEHIVNTDPTGAFPMRQLLGHDGADTLAGGPGNDFIEGKGGNDRLYGGGGGGELGGGGSTGGDDPLMGGSG